MADGSNFLGQAVCPNCLQAQTDGPVTVGQLWIDADRREVTVGGAQVWLTKNEFDILWAIARRRGSIATNHEIAEATWGSEMSLRRASASIKVRMVSIRKKLGDQGSRGAIINVRSVGYRLETQNTSGTAT